MITHTEARQLARMFGAATVAQNRAITDKTNTLLNQYLEQYHVYEKGAVIGELLQVACDAADAARNFTNEK